MALFDRKSKTESIEKALDTVTMRRDHRLGLSVRTETVKSLEEVARYNPILSSAIRHIISNCYRVKYSEWNGKEQVENSPMTNTLTNPSAFLPDVAVYSQLFFDYLFWGNAYAEIIKTGDTVYLNPIPYSVITPKFNMRDGLVDLASIEYEIKIKGKTITKTSDEIFAWSDYSFGMENYRGIPKIVHLLYALTNSDNADRFNESYIKNGGVPSGFFSTESTNPEVLKKLVDEYKRAHGDPDKAGAMGFIGGNAKWIQTGTNINEMSFEILKQVSRTEILALYNIPPLLIGITNDVNYAVAQVERKLFIEVTIKPIVDSFAATIQKKFTELYPSRKFGTLYADVDSLPEMQQDLLSKLQTAMYAVNLGFDLKDVAQELNLPFQKVNESSQSVPVQASVKNFEIIKSATRNEFRGTMRTLLHSRKTQVEKGYVIDLEKFFVSQRNELLDKVREIENRKSLISDYVDELLMYANGQTESWNKSLRYITGKYLTNVSSDVAQKFIVDVGLVYRQTAAEAFAMSTRVNKIVGVNDTTFKLLDDSLRSAIANSQDYRSAIEAMTQTVRSVFDTRKNGSGIIAQTEGNGYANEVTQISYADNNVSKISWLTAGDELVRPSHAAIDGETIELNGMFSNGLRYPGDQNGDAGEVINCRCSTLPEA